MSDVECPYCGEDQKINHDDGQGYKEDVLHRQECRHCSKTFVFNTYVSCSYITWGADCLNGAEHDWKLTQTRPVFFTQMRCSVCDEKRKLTAEERKTHGIPDKFVL